jgi:hypothetical protein
MPKYTARRVKNPAPRGLSPLDAARLANVRERYGDEDPRPDEEWIEESYLEVWEFDVDAVHTYTLWHYHVDSGAIFHVNTAEVFGDVIQFGFGGPGGEENEVAEALEEAFKKQRKAKAVEPSGEALKERRGRGEKKKPS